MESDVILCVLNCKTAVGNLAKNFAMGPARLKQSILYTRMLPTKICLTILMWKAGVISGGLLAKSVRRSSNASLSIFISITGMMNCTRGQDGRNFGNSPCNWSKEREVFLSKAVCWTTATKCVALAVQGNGSSGDCAHTNEMTPFYVCLSKWQLHGFENHEHQHMSLAISKDFRNPNN